MNSEEGEANRPEGDEECPWEQPGAARRDYEPHRGRMLYTLGVTSLVCGLLLGPLVVPACIGLPLGVTVWLLATHDLGRMRAGFMDPAGRRQVETAWTCGLIAVLASLAFGLVTGFTLWAMLTSLAGC